MRHKIMLLALMMVIIGGLWGQAIIINENIQNWTNRGSYGSYTQSINVKEGTGTVSMVQCIVSNTASSTGDCTQGRVQISASTGIVEFPEISSIGIVEFSLVAGSTNRSIKLQKKNK